MSLDDLKIERAPLSLRGKLVEQLRLAILEGRFAPGERLPESRLCEAFGVSRGLLREAMQQLAAEDLVVNIPHRGPVVASIDQRQAEEIYRVRGVLEGLAAEDFARNASPAQRQRLYDITAELHDLADESRAGERVEVKNRFYETLIEGADNRVVGQFLVQLNNRVSQLRRLSLSVAGRYPETLREIDRIIDAIKAGDATAAREAAEDHVRRATDVILAQFPASSSGEMPDQQKEE
ncbi:GntR family transcriptional regulator [Fodinicurvata fenggangensis]|uniref:GntR family transcriptional regulator n=1 Tax=Fodinicurvata fenggangensis TaxID=1121830 RepID=UPI00068ACAA7|nr:GntR family transcriptional regulator [Fodinicurvata fenggangensis]